MSPDIVVLPAPPRAPGGLGGLWVKITAGYEWLLERYEPDIILRPDVDALIIGAGIEAGLRGLRYPSRRTRLCKLITLARENAYIAGEHALGGCYIHSRMAAYDIYAKGWFKDQAFSTSKLGEDHIIALITVAAGYRLADFGRPEDPMSLLWRGLPSHPSELLANKKPVTHSVRSWGTLEEPEIRKIF